MAPKDLLILGATLVTWAGVWVYLVRLNALAKRLERELKHREEESAPIASTGERAD